MIKRIDEVRPGGFRLAVRTMKNIGGITLMQLVARLLRGQARSLVGVDVGDTHVRLLELDRLHSERRVRAYASTALPVGAVQNRQIVDAESVAATIAAAFKQSGTHCREVAVAIPDAIAFQKIISVPALSDIEHIEKQIIADAANHIPYDISEVNFDFHTLGPDPDNPAMTRVLLVACRRDYIELLCAVFEMARARVGVIDVEALALQNACHFLPEATADSSGRESRFAIFNIAGPKTRMYIQHGQTTLHTREMDFDTRELLHSLEPSNAARTDMAIEPIPTGFASDQPSHVPHESALNLASHINDALDFHQTVVDNDKVEIGKVVITGIAATHTEFQHSLARHLQRPVTFGNPLSGMSVDASVVHSAIKADAPALMVATGLATRRAA